MYQRIVTMRLVQFQRYVRLSPPVEGLLYYQITLSSSSISGSGYLWQSLSAYQWYTVTHVPCSTMEYFLFIRYFQPPWICTSRVGRLYIRKVNYIYVYYCLWIYGVFIMVLTFNNFLAYWHFGANQFYGLIKINFKIMYQNA